MSGLALRLKKKLKGKTTDRASDDDDDVVVFVVVFDG